MTALQSMFGTLVALVYGAPREEGQTMAEYGLLLAGIAVLAMGAVFLLGPAISALFTSITGQIAP